MRLLAALVTRNGIVVDTSPAISALTGSNTAAIMLGGMEQAIATMYYLVKYITKEAFDPSSTLTLLQHARTHVQANPSRAPDAATDGDVRRAKQTWQRLENLIAGATVTSTTQAVANLLGFRAHHSSDAFVWTFPWATVA